MYYVRSEADPDILKKGPSTCLALRVERGR